MEETEYLPSEYAARYYRGKPLPKTEAKMKGKFLTRNIVLFRECTNKECGVVDEMNIQELLDYGCEEDCHNCGSLMVIGQECIIRN